MALVRVRSKTSPKFESIVSEEWVDRFPDDWDVIGDDTADAKVPAVARREAEQANRAGISGYADDTGY